MQVGGGSRTWQSLKSRFSGIIMKQLGDYDLSPADRKLLMDAAGSADCEIFAQS